MRLELYPSSERISSTLTFVEEPTSSSPVSARVLGSSGQRGVRNTTSLQQMSSGETFTSLSLPSPILILEI